MVVIKLAGFVDSRSGSWANAKAYDETTNMAHTIKWYCNSADFDEYNLIYPLTRKA